MTGHRHARMHRAQLILAAVSLLVILGATPQAFAVSTCFQQTIPTRTPIYTLPPAPTHTSTPGPTQTPGPPGPTPTLPPATVTQPGITPPQSATAALPKTETPNPAVTATPAQPRNTPAATGALACSSRVTRQDVLPGEEIEYALLITNTGTEPAESVILQDWTTPGADLVRISATQGSVEVDAGRVILRFGILESGQSALAILTLQIDPSVQPGRVFVQQATAYFDGGQSVCNAVAFGTRPNYLPATGDKWRRP